MMTPARARYTGYRFCCEIISHAVWLYFGFPLGLRMVEELLAARGMALVQTARSDRLRWYAERAEVGNGQTEDCRRAVQGSPLRPRRRHPVRALVSSL